MDAERLRALLEENSNPNKPTTVEQVERNIWQIVEDGVPSGVFLPHRIQFVRVSPEHIERLEALRASRKQAFRETKENLGASLEVDCHAERRNVSFSQACVLASGSPLIGGDPLDVARATDLARTARQVLSGGAPPALAAIGERGVALGRPEEPLLERAVNFLLEAVVVGADPLVARYKTNAHLIASGYPWLAPTFSGIADYRRGLHLAMKSLKGDPLVESLISGAETTRSYSEQDWWWEETHHANKARHNQPSDEGRSHTN